MALISVLAVNLVGCKKDITGVGPYVQKTGPFPRSRRLISE